MKKIILLFLVGILFSSCTIIGAAVGASATKSDTRNLAAFQTESDLSKMGPPSYVETITLEGRTYTIQRYEFSMAANTTTTFEVGQPLVHASMPANSSDPYREFHLVGNEIVYAKTYGISTSNISSATNTLRGAGVGLLIDLFIAVLAMDALMM